MFFDILILFTNIFGDIRRSIKLPKIFSEGIRKNCGQKVYFNSTRWTRPKLGSNRTLKVLKIRKFEIQTSISPAGHVQSANRPGSKSGLPDSIFLKFFFSRSKLNPSKKKKKWVVHKSQKKGLYLFMPRKIVY
jgi:hypothetical protein